MVHPQLKPLLFPSPVPSILPNSSHYLLDHFLPYLKLVSPIHPCPALHVFQ